MCRNLGIARNVLAAKLKDLVADGLLERRRYRTDPDWYEYVLTDAGHDLYGAVVALLHWADVHLPATGDEKLRLRHRPAGAAPTPRSFAQLVARTRRARGGRGVRLIAVTPNRGVSTWTRSTEEATWPNAGSRKMS